MDDEQDIAQDLWIVEQKGGYLKKVEEALYLLISLLTFLVF